MVFKGELEHRRPKARYLRTSRKNFTKQLAQIERRQARIRRIREQLVRTGRFSSEIVASAPDVRYNMAKSQNYPVALTQFVQKHAGDPATVVRRSHLCSVP
jgi:hypothetical protein